MCFVLICQAPLKLMSTVEVVTMLSGCAQWSVDLLSWLTDGLFSLRDDPKFKEIIQSPGSFSDMTNYLRQNNVVFLHLILASSTRCFLATMCKRLTHLHAVCHKAQEHWLNASDRTQTPDTRALESAYMKLLRAITTNLVKIADFELLLSTLSEGVRHTYRKSFATLQRNVQQQHEQQQQQNQNQNQPTKPGQPTPGEQAFKKATAQCEQLIFFGEQPPPSFQMLIKQLFETDLEKIMGGSTKRFELFFTDFPLLEVEDDKKRLAARRADGKFVDVFKRVEILAPKLLIGGGGGSSSLNGNGGGLEQQPPGENGLGIQHQQQQNGGQGVGPTYRTCVRCCSVMEEVLSVNVKPGYGFLMQQQQRKCSCGGSWAFLP